MAHDSNGNMSSRLSLGGILVALAPFWASEMPFEARFRPLGPFPAAPIASAAGMVGVLGVGRPKHRAVVVGVEQPIERDARVADGLKMPVP